VRQFRSQRLFVGSPATLRGRLGAFARQIGVEEVMVTTLIHDHALRHRSYALLAEAFALRAAAP
jgi:alkanesulfonate monooxygenase SsuD/methylene tetrahydromethanopterin reductase-like flavin-dependent oxidoreductase (luciferase family)